jgi:hypothetical protein
MLLAIVILSTGCDMTKSSSRPRDGSLKWTFTADYWVISSPAVASDGTLYFGSGDWKVYAINTRSGGPADSPWPMFRGGPQRNGRQRTP